MYFFGLSNMRKMQFCFPENMLGKFLGFGRMQESKISFVFVFYFSKKEGKLI